MVYAKQSIADGREPRTALEYNLQNSADEGTRDIYSWCIEIDRLDDLRFPAGVLEANHLSIAIAIVRRSEGRHPRYIVMLAMPKPGTLEFWK